MRLWLQRLLSAKRTTSQVPDLLIEATLDRREESLHLLPLLPRLLARLNQWRHQLLTAVPCSTMSRKHDFEQLP